MKRAAACSAIAILFLSEAAGAAPAFYRLVDLGTASPRPGAYQPSLNFGVAINNSGLAAANSGTEPPTAFYSDSINRKTVLYASYGSIAYAINDHGTAAGLVWSEDGQSLGEFKLNKDGLKLYFSPVYRDQFFAYGINNLGTTTGYHLSADNSSIRGYIKDNDNGLNYIGNLTDGTFSYGFRINDNGDVLAYGDTTSQRLRPFLWRGGLAIDIGSLNNMNSIGSDINANGHVVGSSDAPGRISAFIWRDGVLSELGDELTSSFAYGLNDKDEVVGIYGGAPTLWSDGQRYTISDYIINGTGYQLSYVADINNRGQIVGTAIRLVDGTRLAVRLDPSGVPEPYQWIYMLIGLFSVGISVRRRAVA